MNKMKIFGIILVAVLAVAALGAGVVYAQSPSTGFGPGWMMGSDAQSGYAQGRMGGRGGMMGGYAQNGYNTENMAAMHAWMTAGEDMHTLVWDVLADKLGLTSDELTAEVNSGKTVAQIAADKGISSADLAAAMQTAHEESLAQAVQAGTLTQEQADAMQAQMAGQYETMLNNMTSAGGFRGGMMNGQGGAGGCQGGLNGTQTNQPRP